MLNRKLMTILFLLMPLHVYASDFTGVLSFMYIMIVVPFTLLIYLGTTIAFYREGDFRSRAFTIKYITGAMLVPTVGIGIMAYEYSLVMDSSDSHIGDLITGIIIYSFLILIFASPYHFHRNSSHK